MKIYWACPYSVVSGSIRSFMAAEVLFKHRWLIDAVQWDSMKLGWLRMPRTPTDLISCNLDTVLINSGKRSALGKYQNLDAARSCKIKTRLSLSFWHCVSALITGHCENKWCFLTFFLQKVSSFWVPTVFNKGTLCASECDNLYATFEGMRTHS